MDLKLVEKVLNRTHKRNANENWVRYQFSSIGLAKIKTSDNSLCWRGCLIHWGCWYKSLQTSWKGTCNVYQNHRRIYAFTSNSTSKNLFFSLTPTCAKWYVYRDTHCSMICNDEEIIIISQRSVLINRGSHIKWNSIQLWKMMRVFSMSWYGIIFHIHC